MEFLFNCTTSEQATTNIIKKKLISCQRDQKNVKIKSFRNTFVANNTQLQFQDEGFFFFCNFWKSAFILRWKKNNNYMKKHPKKKVERKTERNIKKIQTSKDEILMVLLPLSNFSVLFFLFIFYATDLKNRKKEKWKWKCCCCFSCEKLSVDDNPYSSLCTSCVMNGKNISPTKDTSIVITIILL